MKLTLKRKDGKLVNGEIRILNSLDIDKIMKLQEIIVDGLLNKELFIPSSREEYLHCLDKIGVCVGVFTEEDELIAMGAFLMFGEDENNYGYDLGLKKEELKEVGQIESTIVLEEYRGNRLQRIICEELEKIGVNKGAKVMTATASPLNNFSVNTFVNLGYDIVLDKLKYGGFRRYVLRKNL